MLPQESSDERRNACVVGSKLAGTVWELGAPPGAVPPPPRLVARAPITMLPGWTDSVPERSSHDIGNWGIVAAGVVLNRNRGKLMPNGGLPRARLAADGATAVRPALNNRLVFA